MSVRIVTIILGLTFLFLLPGKSTAFDGERHGFILGFGAGYGGAKDGYLSNSGVSTSFKIGAGLNDQLLVYYSNQVVFYSEYHAILEKDAFRYLGMSSIAASYFLNPISPSFFFSGELGYGASGFNTGGSPTRSKLGFTVGAGYEFTRHVMLEASYMHASTKYTYNFSSFRITLNWLGF